MNSFKGDYILMNGKFLLGNFQWFGADSSPTLGVDFYWFPLGADSNQGLGADS
jgi:hypothetical protein